MTRQEALSVLGRNHFLSYFGPGYHFPNAIDSFMGLYPRRKGISSKDKDRMEIYDACLTIKREQSAQRKSTLRPAFVLN